MNDSLDPEVLDSGAAAVPGEEVAPAESTTPGAVLRRAREAREQSIADVVQVIRFSARQIEALERDDYASLPGATAVRGLVRNYAKFLKLDPAPLLAQLEPAVPVPEADVRPPTNMGEALQLTIVERLPLRHSAAAVATVVLLALVGYVYLGLPGTEGFILQLGGSDSSPPATAAAPAAAGPAAVPVLAPTPAVIQDLPAEGVAASGAPPAGSLRIEFDDRSWVEIRDATQKVVYSGEYPAGTRQNVEGKPPYQVWIGKASGVRLFMDERSIDLKPHTREEVARFSLE